MSSKTVYILSYGLEPITARHSEKEIHEQIVEDALAGRITEKATILTIEVATESQDSRWLVKSGIASHYLKDGDGSIWVYRGSGNYTLLYTLDDSLSPIWKDYPASRIEDRWGIALRTDVPREVGL